MAEIRLLKLPRFLSGAKKSDPKSTGAGAQVTEGSGEERQCNCWCGDLKKLLQRLKKQGRKLRRSGGGRRRSSIQCRYDPMSYSLNFDTSDGGSFADEEFYRFCAFSSRFAAHRSSVSPAR